MNHYPHHIGDFDKATRHLNRLERSIYRDLLDVYYETELPLTLELDKLKRKILATTEQESTAVEQVLSEFFLETPNGWFHSRCDVEILKFQDNTTQKALAGKASAAAKAARKQQALNGRLTDVEQTYNGTSTNQNLEPITKNQEPKKKPAPLCVALSVLVENGFDEQTAKEFISHKTKIKAPLTARAWYDHLAESQKAGWTPKAAAEKVMAKNWKGFEAKYVANEATGSAYEPPYAKYMREKIEKMSPSIAAPNPNNPSQPKRLDPNEFLRTIEAQNVIRIN
jgi:uncharacterized protein YdaU (DUF1376 family)